MSPLSVAQYMTRAPYAASPEEPLLAARRRMEEHAIRHLPVASNGKLVGLLSDRDLQLVWTLAHAPPDALTVQDAMTPAPYSVPPDARLEDVARDMAERKIGSAVVVERGRIVGVFTSTDAMHALADVIRAERAPEEISPDRRHGVHDRIRSFVASAADLSEPPAVDRAISAVLCTLTERLTAGEAHALLDGLRTELRTMFAPCVMHREGRPLLRIDRPEFVARVAEHLDVTPAHAELVCEAVFSAVRRELPEKLVRDVAHQLPRGLVQLWLAGPPEPSHAQRTLSGFESRRVIVERIEAAGPLPPGTTTDDVFAAVMCAFSERLSGGEAREVLLGLPEGLRPLVRRCMLHRAEPPYVFGRDGLVARIAEHLHVDDARAEALVRATLSGLRRVLPDKAAVGIASQLPGDLLELWNADADGLARTNEKNL